MEVLTDDGKLTAFGRLHSLFYAGQFDMPREGNVIASRIVIEDDGRVIGAGIIAQTFEAVMVLDQSQSDLKRTHALDLLIAAMKREAIEQGMNQIHVYVTSAFARSLSRRYGFEFAQYVPMVLDLKGGV